MSGRRGEAGSYGLHPALLDSALHAWALGLLGDGAAGDRVVARCQVAVCVGWGAAWCCGCVVVAGVCLAGGRGGGSSADGALSLVAVDEGGGLVVSVGSLVAREVALEQLRSAGAGAGGGGDSLFGVDWVPVEVDGAVGVEVDGGEDAGTAGVFMDVESLGRALEEGVELPGVVVLDVSRGGVDVGRGDGGGEGFGGGGLPVAVRGVLGGVLGVLQGWLGEERLSASRLVVLTHGAVAVGAGDGVDGLAGAGVWGLVRSAQSECPGRVWLVDVDGEEASRAAAPEGVGV